MIILSNGKSTINEGQGTSPPVGSEPELHHLLINMSAAPGPSTIPTEPPPSFSPYVAEFSLTGTGDVISHDPHLNTDGEALYRFLLSQSRVLPSLRIGFRGKHTEIKQRWVRATDSQGRHTDRTESYTESVTDFDFCIEVCPEHLLALGTAVIPANDEESGYTPAHWSIADNEPVYRGKMVREYEIPLDLQEGSPTTMPGIPARRRKATRKEIKRYKRWLEKKQQLGYPPWMQESEDNLYVDGIMLSIEENPTLRSSKTLRDWADEYCASPKYLKEFQYEKVKLTHIHIFLLPDRRYAGPLWLEPSPARKVPALTHPRRTLQRRNQYLIHNPLLQNLYPPFKPCLPHALEQMAQIPLYHLAYLPIHLAL